MTAPPWLTVTSAGRPGPAAYADLLVAAYEYRRSLYESHVLRCPARNRGDACERCLGLEADEIAAERALEAAR